MPRSFRKPRVSRAIALVASLALVAHGLRLVQAQTEEATAAEDREPRGLREQTIYIPYDKLQKMFEREGRGVFLPYERFQELWQAARRARPETPDDAPPVSAVITSIDSEAVVEKDTLHVTATLQIDVLGTGWIEVPLRMTDVAVLSAQVDDKPARIVTGERGLKKLLMHKPDQGADQIALHLEYAKSYTKAPGQNSVSLDAPRAAVNRWTIRIPEAGVDVNIRPLLAATEMPGKSDEPGDSEDDETVVLAFVGAAPAMRIDWTPKAEGASGLDALVSVQATEQLTLGEGVSRTRVDLDYRISRAELTQLQVEVPGDQKVVSVMDANIRKWDVVSRDGAQLLTISLFEPARGSQHVVLEMEKFSELAVRSLVVPPVIRALGVRRQQGIVLVRVDHGLRADAIRRSGLIQLDREEMPAPFRDQSWTFSYRYVGLPFDLAMQVEKIQPRISVSQLVEARLEPEQLTLNLLANYHIEQAGIFDMTVAIPRGYEVLQVRGRASDGVEAASVDSFVVEGDGPGDPAGDAAGDEQGAEQGAKQGAWRRLKVNLSRKAMGKVGLYVQMRRTLDDPKLLSPTGEGASIAIGIARVDAENLLQEDGRFVLYAPESLRVDVGSLSGLRDISFDEALDEFESMGGKRSPQLRGVLAFAFGAGDAVAELTAQRRKPQVTAQQLLVARVEPGFVKYDAKFFYDIRYSGVKSLRLDVPADIASIIRNDSSELRNSPITPVPDDVPEGYVAWAISGDSELTGSQCLALSWQQPIAELRLGKSVDVDVPRLVPQKVERSEGQIVMVKAESIDLRPSGELDGLDPIDPQRDLMRGTSIPDAAAAAEYHDDWRLTLVATRYELQELKNTSIEKGLLRMVVTRGERVAVQALYRLRSNRQRLEIRFPVDIADGGIEFDNDPLRINGRTVGMERGADNSTVLVSLLGNDDKTPSVLELRYTIPRRGSTLTYPTFPNDPAVQQVTLAAYLPGELAFLGYRGPWTSEMAWTNDPFLRRRLVPRHDINSLVSQISSGIAMGGNSAHEFPIDGRPYLFSTLRPPDPSAEPLQLTAISEKLLHGMVFAAVLVLGVILLARGAWDRLIAICIGVGAVVLLGVFLPTLTGVVLDQTLLLAAVLVGLLWLAVAAARTLPRVGQALRRFKLSQLRLPTLRRRRAQATVPSSSEGGDVDG